MKKLATKLYQKVYGKRCEVRPGIKYFNYHDFDGLKVNNFNFKNSNNVDLIGYFYYYNNLDNDKLILFCHGFGGGHEAYISEINYLAKSGFTVLSFDYAGTILSKGDEIGGLLEGLKDVDEVLDYIKANYQFKTIYLVGHSQGGFIVTNVILYRPEVKKVVSLSAFISIFSLYKQMMPPFLAKDFKNIEEAKYPKYKNVNSIKSLNGFKGKALIFHSIDDKTVKFKNSFAKLENAIINENVTFIRTDKKNHNVSYKVRSVVALKAYLKALKKLKSVDEMDTLRDKTDFKTLCELDEDIMKIIVEFLGNPDE